MNAQAAPTGPTLTSVLGDVQNFVGGTGVNVLYKAFALVAILMVLAMVPATSKFAPGAAWIILVLLLIQKGS